MLIPATQQGAGELARTRGNVASQSTLPVRRNAELRRLSNRHPLRNRRRLAQEPRGRETPRGWPAKAAVPKCALPGCTRELHEMLEYRPWFHETMSAARTPARAVSDPAPQLGKWRSAEESLGAGFEETGGGGVAGACVRAAAAVAGAVYRGTRWAWRQAQAPPLYSSRTWPFADSFSLFYGCVCQVCEGLFIFLLILVEMLPDLTSLCFNNSPLPSES